MKEMNKKLKKINLNYKKKEKINDENDKSNNERYDELSDSQINENIRDIKRMKKKKVKLK